MKLKELVGLFANEKRKVEVLFMAGDKLLGEAWRVAAAYGEEEVTAIDNDGDLVTIVMRA